MLMVQYCSYDAAIRYLQMLQAIVWLRSSALVTATYGPSHA